MEVDDQSQRYIEPFPVAEQLRLVDGVNLFDFLHGVAPPLKFHREAPLVDRLKESRSFVLVDLNGGTDDVVDA